MMYFKIAFFSISCGLTVGLIVFGLFSINLNDISSIGYLALRSITVGIIVGVILGLLNMYLKILPGRQKK